MGFEWDIFALFNTDDTVHLEKRNLDRIDDYFIQTESLIRVH